MRSLNLRSQVALLQRPWAEESTAKQVTSPLLSGGGSEIQAILSDFVGCKPYISVSPRLQLFNDGTGTAETLP
jgi:hypothetical protein